MLRKITIWWLLRISVGVEIANAIVNIKKFYIFYRNVRLFRFVHCLRELVTSITLIFQLKNWPEKFDEKKPLRRWNISKRTYTVSGPAANRYLFYYLWTKDFFSINYRHDSKKKIHYFVIRGLTRKTFLGFVLTVFDIVTNYTFSCRRLINYYYLLVCITSWPRVEPDLYASWKLV